MKNNGEIEEKIELEKRIKSLEQQVNVLQDFTGLKEQIKKGIERYKKELEDE